ncbi:unnamed protein product [Adineta ricciae]|uniref:EXS domain-containing protein n=2 Tax=Adineta ricciae TaxID=249248 RepID=A0A815AH42_ADIRI|nr:unnamed protein product [Adineta ricciae]
MFAGINVYGWSSAGVNHILIFEIDPRNHLTYQQLLEIGACLCVFWCLSFIAFILTSYFDFYPFVQPLVFVLLMAIFLVNPAPIFYRPARYWLLRTVGLIFSSAFHRIHFADNWLCNQLTSIELAFFDLEYFFCFYFSNHQWWSTRLTSSSKPEHAFCTGWSRFLLQACLLATPSLLRLTQCLRRYYDTKLKFPHLVNATKYFASTCVAITNSLRRGTLALNKNQSNNPTKNPFVYTWIIAAFINSTFKVIWDIKMDWGLFHKNAGENRFLRDHIIYPSKKYYYYAMVQDVVFRYSWTINIFIQFHTAAAEYSDVVGFAFGFLELIRRFSWNFFRLENEHLNNCGRYRAIRDISIKPIGSGVDFTLFDSKSRKKSRVRSRLQSARCETIAEESSITPGDDLETSIANFVQNQMSASRSSTIVEANVVHTTSKNASFRRCYSLSSLDNYSHTRRTRKMTIIN